MTLNYSPRGNFLAGLNTWAVMCHLHYTHIWRFLHIRWFCMHKENETLSIIFCPVGYFIRLSDDEVLCLWYIWVHLEMDPRRFLWWLLLIFSFHPWVKVIAILLSRVQYCTLSLFGSGSAFCAGCPVSNYCLWCESHFRFIKSWYPYH